MCSVVLKAGNQVKAAVSTHRDQRFLFFLVGCYRTEEKEIQRKMYNYSIPIPIPTEHLNKNKSLSNTI